MTRPLSAIAVSPAYDRRASSREACGADPGRRWVSRRRPTPAWAAYWPACRALERYWAECAGTSSAWPGRRQAMFDQLVVGRGLRSFVRTAQFRGGCGLASVGAGAAARPLADAAAPAAGLFPTPPLPDSARYAAGAAWGAPPQTPVLKRRTGWMVTGLWAGVPEGGTGGHNPATGPARKGPGPPQASGTAPHGSGPPPEVPCASCSSPVRSTV
jgi:hypothetical protein